jgi:hypothetical protein
MTGEDDDITVDIELRSTEELAARLVILAGLIQLALSFGEDDNDPTVVESERLDLLDALRIGQVTVHLSPSEHSLLATIESKAVDEETVLGILWQVEALAALGWAAIYLPELSDPWQQADVAKLMASVPPPWEELDCFFTSVRSRPEDEIAAARETAELWGWRTSLESEIELADGRDRAELIAILREATTEAAHAGLIRSSASDFNVRGRPFSQSDSETQITIAEVSTQRLRALNWLCGFGSSWDDVPLNV